MLNTGRSNFTFLYYMGKEHSVLFNDEKFLRAYLIKELIGKNSLKQRSLA